MESGHVSGDDLDIPDFLKRADKAASVKSEVVMTEVDVGAPDTDTPKPRPKRKASGKANGASKPPKAKVAAPKAKKAAAKAPKAKAKAPKKAPAAVDAFGFREGTLKSQAAAMYASKKGATLAEVKDKVGSIQLNLLKALQSEGYKVSKVKEDGEGSRQVTRYFLRSK